MRVSIVSTIIVFLFFAGGCATVYNPATGRKEFVLIDTAREVEIGKDASQIVESELKMSENYNQILRVRRLGQAIAKVSDRQDLEYYFKVVQDDAMNAFAIPGGYVYVHTGLLNSASEDELACVIAHEVGHIAARHSVKALEAASWYNLFVGLALRNEKYKMLNEVGNIAFNLIHLKYSRQDEALADSLAIKYAYKAGYNPNGMVSFFEKLKAQAEKEGIDEGIEFLRSHPNLSLRIENVKKEIDLLTKKP